MEEIKQAVKTAVKDLFTVDIEPELARTDEQFGDFATNVALQLAAKLNDNPVKIAEAIVAKLGNIKAEVAGPGFINIHLSDETLAKLAFEHKIDKPFSGQEILVEFGDPNPLKAMHLGHLYTAIVGDTVAHLFEAGGAEVERLSYHGDVGLHVAKCLWAVQQKLKVSGESFEKLLESLNDQKIGQLYADGARAYTEDEDFAEQIKAINSQIYSRENQDINQIYDVLVKKSFEVFDEIFKELGIKYNKRYLESESAKVGAELVNQNLGKVFENSDGAVVFKGEKVGLHTRVFISSAGLPTYEAKDLGLVELKNRDYPNAKKSVVITANEQAEYFKVMLAALNEFKPDLAAKTTHISHGFLSLTTGKMSSRTGEVHAAGDLMEQVKKSVDEQYPKSDVGQDVYLAAIKYAFLKQRIGGDIVFGVKESVALEGNSGPYVQYAHARAWSILTKATLDSGTKVDKFEPTERSLARKIGEYPEVVDKAVQELMPHHICTYLYELAQVFNRFYEKNRVIGNEREAIRLKLVSAYADVLKNGLGLLNISAPDKM